MLSSISLHPFISHFPIALFAAGLMLLAVARWKKPELQSAASFNLSLGFLAAILANFSGMVSSDLGLRTTVEVEGHQGYSFLFTILIGFATGYSYTAAFSRTAVFFYAAGLLSLTACIYSGYTLVF